MKAETAIELTKKIIETKARDYEKKIEKMYCANPHPSRIEYTDGIVAGLQIALSSFPLPEQIDVPKPDFGFAEWAAYYYIRLHGCWVFRYADQRNDDNYLTSEELYEIYKDLK